MRLALLRATAAVVIFTAVVGWWPFPDRPGGGPTLEFVIVLGGIVAPIAAGIIAGIAWRVTDRPPLYLALGCFALAQALAIRLFYEVPGTGLYPTGATTLLPAIGLALASPWFLAATVSPRPQVAHGRLRTRLLFVAIASATVVVTAALLADPSLLPGEGAVTVLTGLVAAAYLSAGLAWMRAWWLLRLRSQLILFATNGGLAACTVAAAGSWPGPAPWPIDLAIPALAALVAAACLLEARDRPGLRTLALGLLLPRAASHMARGDSAPMGQLIEAIQGADDSLRGHVNRVAALSIRIGMRLRLNASHLHEIALAAQLHDIGKIAMPMPILGKPATLTPEEYEVMKQHPRIGEQIVRRVPALAVAARGVGEHHERWDGAGYPNAREGSQISLTARIVAVADVYDALVSTRVYKEGWDPAEALAEVQRGAGSQFDPAIVDELAKVLSATLESRQQVAA